MNVRDTDDYIKNMLGIKKEQMPNQPEQINAIEPTILATTPVVEQPLEQIDTVKETPEVTEQSIEDKKSNPNVYAQSDNIDIIDISSLYEEPKEEVSKNTTPEIETPEVIEKPINTSIEEQEEELDPMTKVKLATAIRLAKDTVEDIKTAGYNVTMEEKNRKNKYQIIINVEK